MVFCFTEYICTIHLGALVYKYALSLLEFLRLHFWLIYKKFH